MTAAPTSMTGPALWALTHPATRGRQPDAESLSLWTRLHAVEPVRRDAIAELHERLRREARFHIHRRAATLPNLPRSDLDDLAVQAANDALVVLLRKLDDYRGDSQFWTWAKRFVQLEAPVSIRRSLGRERRVPGDPERPLAKVAAPGGSVHDRAEVREILAAVTELIGAALTPHQRAVIVAIAIDGVPVAKLADDLNTTPGAIYKSLHDARVKLRTELGPGLGHRRTFDFLSSPKESGWTFA
jgi:RNA polymerase sigma-70 factor, ECF subfamily